MADLEDFEIDQSRRIISVEAFPLGVNKVIAVSFEGVEALSVLSSFRVELISKGRALKPSELLGQQLGVAVRYRDHQRHFNGIVSRFEIMQSNYRNLFRHAIDLSPPAWLLTLNQRSKIFPNTAAHEIVSKILAEGNIDADIKAVGDQREYWAQYNESDFTFIQRLLEEHGLFFRFDYATPSCRLITGDGSADYDDSGSIEMFNMLDSWQPQYSVGPSSFRHAAWDYQAVNLMDGQTAASTQTQPAGMGEYPVFEYPGRHASVSEGDRLAQVRMGELDSKSTLIPGTSTNPMAEVGKTFSIDDRTTDLIEGDAGTYVIARVEHSATDLSSTPFGTETSYANSIQCLPSTIDFRPPRVTARPLVHGPQTATVTDTPDPYGRAKVKFHWEAQAVSRWVRVAQAWAYNGMGTQFLPRVGSEVVVEFLEGDPDQPLIVGMVYNGSNKQPYDTSANKTQSGIRGANWGEPGQPDQSNELRFEDKAGAEEVFIHAQRDFRRVVVNDDKLTVEQGNRTIDIQSGNVTETLAQGDYKTTLSQGNHVTILSLGNHSLKMEAGSSTIEAMESITFKVGENSITIDQTGVTIQGIMISVQGEATADVSSPMTSVSGDGALTLQGGVVMIN